MLLQVKQARGILQSFYYESKGGGSLYNGKVVTNKEWNR